MMPMTITPPAAQEIDAWCSRQLGSGVAEILFDRTHLSYVVGVRLIDGREVVVKVRAPAARLTVCTQVQAALWRAGIPCPEPLAGPAPFGDWSAGAESLKSGGEMLSPDGGAVHRYAELLARLVRLAPDPGSVGPLAPNPPWTAWDHGHRGIWPPPDDRDDDLNAHPAAAWLDEVGSRVRDRLRRAENLRPVIGHGDWEGQNLRWRDGQPWAVHDWDSVISAPEPIIVGLAASVWRCGPVSRAATVDESAAFVEAYQDAAGRRWSTDELQASWAAGLWVYAFNAKKASLDGHLWLGPAEAQERLSRAAA
jgi:hypothetical protein